MRVKSGPDFRSVANADASSRLPIAVESSRVDRAARLRATRLHCR
jgi:hypothetical protein